MQVSITSIFFFYQEGHRNRIIVGFTTTYAVCAYHH